MKIALAASAAGVLLASGGYGYVAWETRDAPAAARLRDPSGGSIEPAGASGSLDGRWVLDLSDTDYVGYRIRERIAAISAPNDVVGRTKDAHGSLVVTGQKLVSASVRVNMQTLSTGVAPRDQMMRSSGLETDRFGRAEFRLLKPVRLDAVRRGDVVHRNLKGALTLHGVRRNVTVPVDARWNGATVQVAGSLPVNRSDYHIGVSDLVGFRIQSSGVLEFELTYARDGRTAAAAAAAAAAARPVARDKGTTGDPFAAAPTRPPCTGNWPEASGRIVTTVQRRGRGQIVVADLASHRMTHITTDAAVDDVSWGPGRNEVTALMRAGDEAPRRLEVLDVTGHRRPRRLDLPAGAEQARWSRNGSSLAYVDVGVSGARVWLSRGSGPGRAVTPDGQYADAPSWSPDGRRLAVSLGEAATNDDIGIVRTTSPGLRRVTRGRAYEYAPSWSPTGDALAYVRDGSVRVMNSDGTGTRPITRAAHDATPTWSPAGTAIAFLRAGSVFVTSSAGPQRPACLPLRATVGSAPDWS